MAKKVKKAEPEILIGYVNSFSYSLDAVKEQMNGLPFEGRIYQIIKHQVVGETEVPFVYELYIGKENNKMGFDTIFLGPTLVGSHNDKWTFNITEINKTNYLDFDYTPEDAELLRGWLDGESKTLRELMGRTRKSVSIAIDPEGGSAKIIGSTTHPTPVSKENIPPMIKEAMEAASAHFAALDTLREGITTISERDPAIIPALAEVISQFRGMAEVFENRPDIVRALLVNSSSHEVTTTFAIANLQNYLMGGGRDVESLMVAITNLIIELHRREVQKTNQDLTHDE